MGKPIPRKISLTVNGVHVEVDEGQTILQAAQHAGIYVPTLCYHPDLPPPTVSEPVDTVYRGKTKFSHDASSSRFEGCKLCAVQVEGEEDLVYACSTQTSANMKVHTESEKVKKSRKAELKRILAKHPHACLICAQKEGCTTDPCSTDVPKDERCCPMFVDCELKQVAEYVGIREDTPRYKPQNLPVVEDEPLFLRDYNLCVGCTRCVRACRELRGVDALGYVVQDGEIVVGTVAPTLQGSDCKFCGACVEVCPTGALQDKGLEAARREAFLVPCRSACPAEVDIPAYVRLISEGKPDQAASVVRERLPLPNILAHSCSRPCEEICRRGEVNEAISICGLKRYALENEVGLWKNKLQQPVKTGKKVAVVGGGSSGLSAAYYLAWKGHSVTIFEAQQELGGMMRYGIQEYRLPRAVVEKDVEEILDLGVEARRGVSLGEDFTISSLLGEGFDAVLLALGLQTSRKLPNVDGTLRNVYGGLEFLLAVSLGETVEVGERVLVIGGGNVAMDAALTAKRLGANEVEIACLEKPEEMPAFQWEIEQAVEEGVKLRNSCGVNHVSCRDDAAKTVELMRCKSVFDKDGNFAPVFDEETTMTVEADTLILAVGQTSNIPHQLSGKLKTQTGLVAVDTRTWETSIQQVFACGDLAQGPSSIVEAVASGKKAALSIDKHLGGSGVFEERLVKAKQPPSWLGREEGFAIKNRVPMPQLPPDQRRNNFHMVELGYDWQMALEEAKRCLRCDLRLSISRPPEPPEEWLVLSRENLESVPEAEGVIQLLSEEKEVLQIKGTLNLKQELKSQLGNAEAKFFTFEEAKMYTTRESELLQQHIKKHGKMPTQNVEIEDDLY